MMDRCPHCGSDYGLYTKEYVTFDQYYKFDGEPDGYGELAPVYYRKDAKVYCCECDKCVGMASKIFPHHGFGAEQAEMFESKEK